MRRRGPGKSNTTGPTRRRRGAVLVEAAVVLPVLFTMILGILEIGRAFEARGIVANAARQAARQASRGGVGTETISPAVRVYLSQAGLHETSAVQVTIQNLGPPATAVPSTPPVNRLSVSVSIPFKDVLWTSYFFSNPQTRLSSTVVWCSVLGPN